jgi:hypothetical protein
MLALLLVSSALAGWTLTDESNDCAFYKGDADSSGVVPLRAECDWPIEASELMGLIEKIDDHNLYFSSVSVSRVVANNGGEHNVYQVHVATGISDREAMLIYGDEAIEGGRRYTWRVNPDQTGITGEKVRLAEDTGMWEISAKPGGGSRAVYELRYDAGGSVPGFVVRWFQGSGVRTLVGELRSFAEEN